LGGNAPLIHGLGPHPEANRAMKLTKAYTDRATLYYFKLETVKFQ